MDFLSDYVAELIEYVPVVPEWLDGGYVSPLVKRVAAVRSEILRRAEESNWVLDEAQLSDQAIIRRMVLKRCIYGVDKNPLTVELAKVSLWLHSFTVGAPLSFLDHHLRSGDSLIGLRVGEAIRELQRLGGIFTGSAIAGAEAATDGMLLIEEMSDADVAEVRASVALFQGVEETTAELRGLLDFLCGLGWLTAGMKQKARAAFETPLFATLGRHLDHAYPLLARGPGSVAAMPADENSTWTAFQGLWSDARSIADREGFLHWEAAFPGVWRSWNDIRPEGGFDAVIGNPPWDRIKLQEVEWFATRKRELALAPTAAARRAAIRLLREQGDPLAAEFDAAKEQSESLSRMVRSCGDYPLLGGGDINLYSLFVERAMSLIKPDGFVGLLTPSGICADKTAARFFKSVSTTGRVGGVFDFENRRLGTNLPPFFPDIDSRFKFCALVFGGEKRQFDQTECAFFLHDTKTIRDKDRCFPLTPADFARVNPNTGTAPVFRTRRAAEITRRIYERHPVLVDRSADEERRVYPVKYVRMFDMTNDSGLFRTREELEEKEGAYPIGGNRFSSPSGEWVPLYEGKMVQAFDHRAASIVVNPENQHRPAQPKPATLEQHKDPNWLSDPQFWVLAKETGFSVMPFILGFKHVTAPTNVRSMIAALIPGVGAGNSLPLLMGSNGLTASAVAALVANLNSVPLDYVVRQKVQGQNLNWFIIEQLPVVPPDRYEAVRFGPKTAGQIVRDAVLKLTYTAHDMTPFARALGYHGPPFTWDDEQRRHLRARLDALYFHLYGLSREDVSYVLDTFPIVRREDEAEFGRYRTRDLILAYMNALAAGDATTVVAM